MKRWLSFKRAAPPFASALLETHHSAALELLAERVS
jgi:hypothetical protein